MEELQKISNKLTRDFLPLSILNQVQQDENKEAFTLAAIAAHETISIRNPLYD